MRIAILAASTLAIAATAVAQPYPTRPVTILNGFPPGGVTDAVVRAIADKLGRRLGQPVVVENRPGASGTIAATAVARAVPDGHTLLFGVAANLAVAPATMAKPPYDPTRAFTPIVEIARGPYLWLVRDDHRARTMTEFVAWTRANPGKINYASPGPGTVHHLATELFKQQTGADMVHVPYKGGSGLATALLGGEVDGMFESPSAYLPHIRAGRLRALALTGHKRLAALPEVPTLEEQGLPALPVHSWWGIVGPAGLPRDLTTRLNAEIAAALAEPDLTATLARMAIEPTPGTPEAFGAYIANERVRWREFVGKSGLKLDP